MSNLLFVPKLYPSIFHLAFPHISQVAREGACMYFLLPLWVHEVYLWLVFSHLWQSWVCCCWLSFSALWPIILSFLASMLPSTMNLSSLSTKSLTFLQLFSNFLLTCSELLGTIWAVEAYFSRLWGMSTMTLKLGLIWRRRRQKHFPGSAQRAPCSEDSRCEFCAATVSTWHKLFQGGFVSCSWFQV